MSITVLMAIVIFILLPCPYAIEGSLNYDDLIADDWEVFEPVEDYK